MNERDDRLSEQAVSILELIAEGRSYDQILQRHPELTYFGIFASARAALDLIQGTTAEVIRGPGAVVAASEPAEPELLPVDLLTVVPTRAAPASAEIVPAPAQIATASVAFPDAEGFEDDPQPPLAESRPTFIERARATHSRAWARWTRDEDARLTALFHQGASRAEMVQTLGRQPGAVRNRLLKLGLISEEDGGDVAGDAAAAARTERSSGQSKPESPNRSGSADPPEMVPGWESFRDRLSPDA